MKLHYKHKDNKMGEENRIYALFPETVEECGLIQSLAKKFPLHFEINTTKEQRTTNYSGDYYYIPKHSPILIIKKIKGVISDWTQSPFGVGSNMLNSSATEGDTGKDEVPAEEKKEEEA